MRRFGGPGRPTGKWPFRCFASGSENGTVRASSSASHASRSTRLSAFPSPNKDPRFIAARNWVGWTGCQGWLDRYRRKAPPSIRMNAPMPISAIGNHNVAYRAMALAIMGRVEKNRPAAHHTATPTRNTPRSAPRLRHRLWQTPARRRRCCSPEFANVTAATGGMRVPAEVSCSSSSS